MMRLLPLCLMLITLPFVAQASYVSGIDDVQTNRESNIDKTVQKRLNDSILTYYQKPDPDKVNTILDIIAYTPLLERKTTWSPLVGFLTVVFPANKDRVMSWISRNDYNPHAQYIIVNSLLHAKMKETAMLFAKANQWEGEDMYRLRETDDNINLKKLDIIVPGHIDTLWGAFFASGDTVYVEQIIDSLFLGKLPEHNEALFLIPEGSNPLEENKTLAAITLRDYAREHKPVRDALEKRYYTEPLASPKRDIYKLLLGIS